MSICSRCHKEFNDSPIGTKQRNHCPFCLWSLHLDENIPGDRKSLCHGLMQPIGLTEKITPNKKLALHAWGAIGSHLPQNEIGELMIVHQCEKCGKFSKNRIAGDDETTRILDLLDDSGRSSLWRLLTQRNAKEVKIQLLSKP